MNNIKNISIRQFLAERGVSPKQERAGYGMYLSPFRTETAPSFKVDYGKNLWYDFGSGEGGSIIDLVMKLDGCTINEAIAKLENGSFSFHRAEPIESMQSPLQIVSVKPLENHHLINYLQSKRSINIDIAQEYCHEVHYTTNGKQFFASVFRVMPAVGNFVTNTSKGAHRQSPRQLSTTARPPAYSSRDL